MKRFQLFAFQPKFRNLCPIEIIFKSHSNDMVCINTTSSRKDNISANGNSLNHFDCTERIIFNGYNFGCITKIIALFLGGSLGLLA